jgi:hypothetical protein
MLASSVQRLRIELQAPLWYRSYGRYILEDNITERAMSYFYIELARISSHRLAATRTLEITRVPINQKKSGHQTGLGGMALEENL